MKKLYYGYCSYTCSTIFLDGDYNFIGEVHENDGNWRGEYFDPIMQKMGIEAEYMDFDIVLKKAGRKFLRAVRACNAEELDYKSFINK